MLLDGFAALFSNSYARALLCCYDALTLIDSQDPAAAARAAIRLYRSVPDRSSARPAACRLRCRQRRPGPARRLMTEPRDTASPAAGFPAAAASAIHEAAAQAGLDARGARLIRLFGTAVYHLPAVGGVARIADDVVAVRRPPRYGG
jgi:hypothetical protein